MHTTLNSSLSLKAMTFASSRRKRDLCIWQKRPMHMAKETYSYGKRDLSIWQKRPIHMAKEIWQKRPIHMAKEIWQKRPIHMAKAT